MTPSLARLAAVVSVSFLSAAIAATTEVALDTGVEMVLSLSDAGHVAYIKKRLATNSGDLYVKKIDGSATCVAETTRPVPFRSVSFVPNAGAILWAHSYTDGFEAHYTRLGDCNTMPVATEITEPLLEALASFCVLK